MENVSSSYGIWVGLVRISSVLALQARAFVDFSLQYQILQKNRKRTTEQTLMIGAVVFCKATHRLLRCTDVHINRYIVRQSYQCRLMGWTLLRGCQQTIATKSIPGRFITWNGNTIHERTSNKPAEFLQKFGHSPTRIHCTIHGQNRSNV